MKELQRIVDLANKSEIKWNKQNVEVAFYNSANRKTTAKMALVDGNNVRTDLAQITYDSDEYDYDDAIRRLEQDAIEKLCIGGLLNILKSPKFTIKGE